MADSNGNGNGHYPPDDLPPPGSGNDGGQEGMRQLVNLIQQVLTQQLDQTMPQLLEAIDQAVTNRFNQMLSESAQRQSPAALAPAPMENPARLNLLGAVNMFLNEPEKAAGAISNVFQAIGQARAIMKPQADLDAMLASIAKTHPQKLALYAPDPLGGHFPELYTQLILMGARSALTGKMGMGGSGAMLTPLGGASAGPDASPAPGATYPRRRRQRPWSPLPTPRSAGLSQINAHPGHPAAG